MNKEVLKMLIKVYRIDYKKYGKYRRLWIEADSIDEAMKLTGLKSIVDYCKLEIKEV